MVSHLQRRGNTSYSNNVNSNCTHEYRPFHHPCRPVKRMARLTPPMRNDFSTNSGRACGTCDRSRGAQRSCVRRQQRDNVSRRRIYDGRATSTRVPRKLYGGSGGERIIYFVGDLARRPRSSCCHLNEKKALSGSIQHKPLQMSAKTQRRWGPYRVKSSSSGNNSDCPNLTGTWHNTERECPPQKYESSACMSKYYIAALPGRLTGSWARTEDTSRQC